MDPRIPAGVAVMFNPLAAGLSWAGSIPATGPGDRVVILGAGQRGLCCVIAARAAGVRQIVITGLTRDGVFWVEDGAIRHAVKNFRFNETPIAVLSKVTGMTKPWRVGNALIPAIRASEFTFSSLSEAV